MQEDITGFLPSMESMSISESNSMITTDGELVHAHSVRLRLRDGSDIVFSVTTDELQKLFFLLLKVLS